eukprot:CAMPEP_0117432888 /NCGR_PEP_ID=MMETSP0758-20121206/12310_1 /TAXON_ID=63605 /ORGANISM="Percolomonas cosmopolitus, Strain AE-1 (ATCC 50343)" /LENGTH=250 /DNA_ID=CAMNT_0005223123 /DNA_START=186 /DNA_END=938 /DNA_ORIENTATION=+
MNPATYANVDYEPLKLKTKDGVIISTWLMKQENKDAPTIIYFHGNAGDIAMRLPSAMQYFSLFNCHVMLVDYRGYGESEGKPTEWGLKIDAETALDAILERDDINKERIFIFGRSLGGAVALDLVAKRHKDVAGAIIENTFTSVPDMIPSLFPYLSYLRIFSRNKWYNSERVKELPSNFPIAFVSGQADRLIPPSMMQKLYTTCTSERKYIYKMENGTHNDTWRCVYYLDRLWSFISEVTGLPDEYTSFL